MVEPNMGTVVGYVRKSTDDPDKQVYSTAAQEAAIREVCKAKSWVLAQTGFRYERVEKAPGELVWKGYTTGDGFYVDTGMSGTIFDRPALKQLMLSVKKREDFKLVLCVNFDRIARDNTDSGIIRKECAKRGVGLAETSAPDMDSGSSTGKLVYGIKGVVAEFEHDLISERTKRAMQLAKSTGQHMGRPPAGFTIVEGKLEPTENMKKAAKIFKVSPQVSPTKVAKELGITYYEAWQLKANYKRLVEVPTTTSQKTQPETPSPPEPQSDVQG